MIASRRHDSKWPESPLLAGWLERIGRDLRVDVDAHQASRLLDDARDGSAASGSGTDDWPTWMADAASHFRLSVRPVDCSGNELVELARSRVSYIARLVDQDVWIACSGPASQVTRSHGPDHRTTTWESVGSLAPLWKEGGADRAVCVVVQARLLDHSDHDPHFHPKPQARLRAWLRPEMPDILMILIYALVAGALSLATPLAVEALVNTVAFGRLLTPVVVLALILFAFLVFSAAMKVLQTMVVEILQQRLFVRVAGDLSARLPNLRADAMGSLEGRETVNRFLDVAIAQKAIAALLLDGISLVLSMLIGMAVLAFYHPWLLGFDLVLVAALVVTVWIMGRGAIRTAIAESRTKYRVTAWLEDLAGCRTAFRYPGGADYAMMRTDRLVHEYISDRKDHFAILLRQITVSLAIQAIASTALLGLGGWLVISGQLSLGQLVAAELIVAVVVGAFTKLGKHLESFYDLMGAVDKIGHLVDLPMEQASGVLSLPTEGALPVRLYRVATGHADHHPEQETEDDPHRIEVHPADSHGGAAGAHGGPVTLHFEAGSRWAVLDTEGAGQSPLGDVVFGLRTPISGYLSINRYGLRDIRLESLRRRVALARDNELFVGSIAENIHVGRTDIPSEALHDALEEVGLIEDVLTAPHGLETVLSTGGLPLLGHQRTKLLIARAMAGRPGVLIVDGLLDALPDDEALEILRRLVDPVHDWTLIVITARASLAEHLPRAFSLQGTALVPDTISHAVSEVGHHA
ncbi:peptidase domain-containing ABC transporter [Planctomyces sp. SH-PL14]|uniref:peptidase domain-containing ABC transporter n=1 Tax=Planctomyces sp. SH-PL14 TaxID=1632864 RepID=UPI00078CC8D3|nr:ATP-binding cassette domain-containing protein [Planctomyces sp. SH-PL14]AMV22375.1 Putative multidrug export ATP-binding/permease protein [Planctomyces sp. SH-PL14]